MTKIRVMCVDDSAFMRSVVTRIVDQQSDMEMVATAPDPLVARERIRQFQPDVLTLDIEMPHMNGLEFLALLMQIRPMPVIMVSSLTGQGTEATLRALELGAVDFVAKPGPENSSTMAKYVQQLTEKIRMAATARVRQKGKNVPQTRLPVSRALRNTQLLVAIGASTGGTEALRLILESLPVECPPILIAQHMPAGFTHSFACRLDKLCLIHVKEAEQGDPVLPGHAYIAPGDFHMEVHRSRAGYFLKLNQEPVVNHHRPSVDRLFHSVAASVGKNGIGVILTGMGNDGARGLLAMREAGAWTLAQSKQTCVVFGMPQEAIALGGVNRVADIGEMSDLILTHVV